MLKLPPPLNFFSTNLYLPSGNFATFGACFDRILYLKNIVGRGATLLGHPVLFVKDHLMNYLAIAKTPRSLHLILHRNINFTRLRPATVTRKTWVCKQSFIWSDRNYAGMLHSKFLCIFRYKHIFQIITILTSFTTTKNTLSLNSLTDPV